MYVTSIIAMVTEGGVHRFVQKFASRERHMSDLLRNVRMVKDRPAELGY